MLAQREMYSKLLTVDLEILSKLGKTKARNRTGRSECHGDNETMVCMNL